MSLNWLALICVLAVAPHPSSQESWRVPYDDRCLEAIPDTKFTPTPDDTKVVDMNPDEIKSVFTLRDRCAKVCDDSLAFSSYVNPRDKILDDGTSVIVLNCLCFDTVPSGPTTRKHNGYSYYWTQCETVALNPEDRCLKKIPNTKFTAQPGVSKVVDMNLGETAVTLRDRCSGVCKDHVAFSNFQAEKITEDGTTVTVLNCLCFYAIPFLFTAPQDNANSYYRTKCEPNIQKFEDGCLRAVEWFKFTATPNKQKVKDIRRDAVTSTMTFLAHCRTECNGYPAFSAYYDKAIKVDDQDISYYVVNCLCFDTKPGDSELKFDGRANSYWKTDCGQ